MKPKPPYSFSAVPEDNFIMAQSDYTSSGRVIVAECRDPDLREFICLSCNSHEALLEACEGLLNQVTGPAMVYGDGRGNDGRKTGLSHQEFNQLRDWRI